MSSLRVKLGILAAGLMLSGCMQATTYEATNQSNFQSRRGQRELLAKISLRQHFRLPSPYRRAIVDYHRKEAPGSIRRRFPTITISIYVLK